MILLDQCVPRRYLRLLHDWGYAANLITDHIPANSPDPDLLMLAGELDAVLLTIDLDFSNILDYPPATYGGILVMRYQIEDEAEVDETLKTALVDLYREELRGALVIVSPHRYRIRR